MGFADFGVGIGSFADGMSKGMGLGKQIKQARKENAIDDAKEQAFKEANTHMEADKAAGNAKPLMDYYMNTSAPRIRDAYLANGDEQTAMIWDKWINDSKTQKGMKYWAQGVVAAQKGDHQGFLDNFMKSYNESGYFDDGSTATGGEVVKGKDGKAIGFKVTFKDKSGNESTQQYDNMEDVYKSGLAFMSPQSVFQYGMDQVKSQQAATAKVAESQSKFKQDVALKNMDQQFEVNKQINQQNFDISRDNNSSQNRITENAAKAEAEKGKNDDLKVRQADAMAKALIARGYSKQVVDRMYPAFLGGYRQSRSPEDELSDAIKIVNSDMTMTGKTTAEKVAAAKALIDEKNAILMQNDSNQPEPKGVTEQPQGNGVLMYSPNGFYYNR